MRKIWTAALLAVALWGVDDDRPPKLIRKVNPEYSPEARSAAVQGSVVFDVVIDERGRPSQIALISPLGFGLDERAQQAILQWEFEPAMKAGNPAPYGAVVEVSFTLPEIWYDRKAEQRRTAFNRALREVRRDDAAVRERGRSTIVGLSRRQMSAAMYVEGRWCLEGLLGCEDKARGERLIRAAAARHYGPGMFRVAQMDFAADPQAALQMMRDAAVLGSTEAQQHLADRYLAGDVVEKDEERAKRYYRLCAAAGEASCQLRLAELLLGPADRSERETAQGFAWLELAAQQGSVAARKRLREERPHISPELWERARRLQSQLTQRIR